MQAIKVQFTPSYLSLIHESSLLFTVGSIFDRNALLKFQIEPVDEIKFKSLGFMSSIKLDIIIMILLTNHGYV